MPRIVLYMSLLIPLIAFPQDKLWQEGEAYFQTRQYQKAVDVFQKVIEEPSLKEKHPEAFLRLGQCYLAIGDLKNARHYFSIALWQREEIARQGIIGVAICDIEEGKYDSAIEALSSLISNEHDRKILAYAYYNRGLAYEKKGWVAKAIDDFQEAILRGYDDEALLSPAKAHLATCQSLYAQFQEEEATYLKRISQETKPDAIRELYHELARKCEDVGEIEKAIKYEEKSIDYSNDENYNAGAWMNIAWRYAINKDYEKSAESFKKVVENYPDSAYAKEALLRMGDMYSKAKMTDKAIEAYEEFLQNYPQQPESIFAFMNIAWRYVDKSDFRKAAETFAKIADSFPNSEYAPEALLRAGDMFAKAGDDALAIDTYLHFIENYPNDERLPTVLLNLAWRYSDIGAVEEEKETLLELNKRFPNTELGWLALGLYYERIGEPQKAVDCFKKSAEFFGPQRALALLNAIGRYYDLGDYDNALKTYKQFLQEYDGKEIEADILLEAIHYAARAYEHLSDYPSAIKTYATFIRKATLTGQLSAHWYIRYRIGYCYLQMGELQKAIDSWKDISETNDWYLKVIIPPLINTYQKILSHWEDNRSYQLKEKLAKKVSPVLVIGPMDYGIRIDYKMDFAKGKVIVVVGTQGSPEENSASSQIGEDFYITPFSLKKDIEITPQDLKENNIVLVGSPKSNKLFSLVKDRLPIKIEDGVIQIANRVYKGANLGIIMIAPNPFNDSKFLWLFCAFDPANLRHIYDIPPTQVADYLLFQADFSQKPEYNILEEGYFLKFTPSQWEPL